MPITKLSLMLVCLIASTLIITSTLMAQEAVTPLMSKDLTDLPGKEGLMYTVEFPPGFSSPVHRHNAQVSVYVLEGSVVMQVRGGKEVRLRPGQPFMKVPTMFTSLAGTQVVQSQQNSLCSWLRTKALHCWYSSSKP